MTLTPIMLGHQVTKQQPLSGFCPLHLIMKESGHITGAHYLDWARRLSDLRWAVRRQDAAGANARN